MRFEELADRLAELPAKLPPAPARLLPVLLPNVDGAGPVVPDFPRARQREAAVLVLLYPASEGSARVVLTERSAGGHRHAGQVSLPGGALDAGESIVVAALREAREEVGLSVDEAGVSVVGTLAPIDVRVSGFRVHPVVATAAHEPALVPDRREVAAIIGADIDAFLPGAPIETVIEERDGVRLRYGAYPVGRYRVWGATARIMGGLGAWLARDR